LEQRIADRQRRAGIEQPRRPEEAFFGGDIQTTGEVRIPHS